MSPILFLTDSELGLETRSNGRLTLDNHRTPSSTPIFLSDQGNGRWFGGEASLQLIIQTSPTQSNPDEAVNETSSSQKKKRKWRKERHSTPLTRWCARQQTLSGNTKSEQTNATCVSMEEGARENAVYASVECRKVISSFSGIQSYVIYLLARYPLHHTLLLVFSKQFGIV